MNDFRYHHINIGLLEHHLISSIFSQCFISDYRLVTLLFYTNLLQRSATHFSWLFSTKKITETKPTSQKSTPPPFENSVRIPVVPASAPNGPFPVTSSSSTAPPTVAPTAWCGSPAAGPAAVDPGAAYASTRPQSKAAWAPPVPSGKETCRYISYPTRNGKGKDHWLK